MIISKTNLHGFLKNVLKPFIFIQLFSCQSGLLFLLKFIIYSIIIFLITASIASLLLGKVLLLCRKFEEVSNTPLRE